jgi:DNA ligase 1
MASLKRTVETWRQVAATRSRTAKVAALAAWLRALEPRDVEIGVHYLAGETRQGKIGLGYAAVRRAAETAPAEQPRLSLSEVDEHLNALAALRGSGSGTRRSAALGELFARATRDEQEFLAHLILGELRQGALAAMMIEAIANAAGVEVEQVRRAAMYAEDFGALVRAALLHGSAGLARFQLQILSPVAPMLARSAADPISALDALGGEAAFEWKIDGARVQAHKNGRTVRVFTRNGNDVTDAVPEVAAAVRAARAEVLVLDGETIALRDDGRPRPFQQTMRRFGRKLDVESLRAELPLHVYFFDCLRLDERSLAERPARERFSELSLAVAPRLLIPRLVTREPDAAERFLREALAAGHEGVMAKALDAPYEAGRRGASWLKIKQAKTLDLVVLAAEWGSGRRRGRLSNLHLGARDPEGGYVMLGKTFKGLTDAVLEWQTEALLALETHREGHVVYVAPRLVVEIAFNDLQSSPRYPAGLALRFARVKGYRPDKRPEEADTVDTVRALYALQQGEPA